MLHLDPASAAVDAVPADPVLSTPPGAARALVERQLALLTELAEIGMEIARASGRRAAAAMEDAAPAGSNSTSPDPTLAYARAARAVRMTIALQAGLLKDLPALERGEASAREARTEARRGRVHRLVERALEARHEDEGEVERLSDETWERLRDEDDFGALLTLPLDQAVARICEDLGLAPDDWVGAVQEPPTASSSGAAQRSPEDPVGATPDGPGSVLNTAHPRGSGS